MSAECGRDFGFEAEWEATRFPPGTPQQAAPDGERDLVTPRWVWIELRAEIEDFRRREIVEAIPTPFGWATRYNARPVRRDQALELGDDDPRVAKRQRLDLLGHDDWEEV